MTRSEILVQVIDIIISDLGWPIDRDAMSSDTEIGTSGLGLDSTLVIELAIHIERRFSIRIEDELILGLRSGTLGDLVSLVESSERRSV